MSKYYFRYNVNLQNEVLLYYKIEKDLNILNKIFNIPKKAIAAFLKSKKVFIKGQYGGKRKYQINKYYFDDINSEEKAYFLGLLYADGSNRPIRGEVNLTLQEKDYYLLVKLNNIINPMRPIINITQNILKNQIFRMYINSKYISNRLNELGVFENKTFKLRFTKFLDENLWSHFIRGYFDGDGSISINKKKSAFIQFIGTESLINDILEILVNNCNVNYVKIRLNHNNANNNIRTISFGGNGNAKKIYKYLYKDAQTYMLRKKNKFELIIQGLK